LCIRPIWHHKQQRIKVDILICFLAYALWKTLQKWQSRSGLGDSPRTMQPTSCCHSLTLEARA